MSKMSQIDSDRQQIERLTDVVPPPSFADSARAGVPAHSPTPWFVNADLVASDHDVVCRVPNHPENGTRWDANAAHIVKAVNNHDALVRALQEIDAIAVCKKAGAIVRMQRVARKALQKIAEA